METPRLALPLLAAGQAQKHVTHNEALLALDAHVHLHVEAISQIAPPSSPVEGQIFGLATNPSGLWSGKGGTVARFQDGAWFYSLPRRGWRATVGNTAIPYLHDGSTWKPLVETGLSALTALAIGSAGSPDQRLAIRSANILFEADPAHPTEPGDIRIKINKTSPGDIASLLFQTGFSGRVEVSYGSSGQFDIRTSSDGATFSSAFAINPVTGVVSLPRQSAFRAIRTGPDIAMSTPNTILPFDGAAVNIGNGYSSTTYRFSAPEDGIYLFSVSAFASVTNTRTIIDLVKNGTIGVARSERADIGGAMELVDLTSILPLAKNDTIEARAVLGTVLIVPGHFNWFAGAKLA
ncbi:C1q domain containing protein [Rhabdaerophilaceae bacterium]